METQESISGETAAPNSGPLDVPDASKSENAVRTSVTRLRAVTSTMPTLLVLGVLCALGWWGHSSDWTLPAFARLTRAPEPQLDDWCDEHGVPNSICVECNPDQYPQQTLYGWCRIHGIHECPFEHPDVAQLKSPALIEPRDVARAERALKLRPRPQNNFACQNPGRRIQFASQDAATKAGVDVEPVLRSPIVESIRATGEIRYDETRIARLASRAAGTVWRVEKEVGEHVEEGELLALIDAAGVGLAKAALQQALADWQFNSATFQRLNPLAETGGVAQSKVLDSESAVRTSWVRVRGAHQALVNLGLPLPLNTVRSLDESELATRLHFLGLSRDAASALDPATTTSNLLPVTSPQSGTIASRYIVAGEVVNTDRLLFTITDTRQMWLRLNIPLEEAGYVALGQRIEFLPDGHVTPVSGTIDWMSTSADQKTRTVSVRATLQNADGRLFNETFGVGTVTLRDEPDTIVVPNEAVQWDGSCSVVFVRDKAWFEDKSPKLFHTRSVRVGAKTNDVTEIIAGVLPGEVVATVGSDVLRAQLLKNNLGAG